MLKLIFHPTDFSSEGHLAFLHALALARAARAGLDLLHVHSPHDNDRWDKFPHVREVLERWGVLAPGAATADIEAQSGIRVHKVELREASPVEALSRFLISHRPDLVVMASHGREGINRLLSGSISSEVAQETRAPTLLFGPAAKPFIDLESGAITLETVLVPVAHDPDPACALPMLSAVTAGLNVAFDFVHAGEKAPELNDATGAPIAVRCIEGSVVEGIVAAASGAQLIAMPTAGQQGFLDALRGSTTEQVVRHAPCPVLALPDLASRHL